MNKSLTIIGFILIVIYTYSYREWKNKIYEKQALKYKSKLSGWLKTLIADHKEDRVDLAKTMEQELEEIAEFEKKYLKLKKKFKSNIPYKYAVERMEIAEAYKAWFLTYYNIYGYLYGYHRYMSTSYDVNLMTACALNKEGMQKMFFDTKKGVEHMFEEKLSCLEKSCSNCGKKVGEDNFCINCGKKLKG